MSIEVEQWNGESPPDAVELRRKMESEGYTVFEWTDAPGTTYGRHAHAEDQSHWVLSGALTLIIGSEEHTLRAGDRDFLPAGTTHAARVVGSEPVTYLMGAKY